MMEGQLNITFVCQPDSTSIFKLILRVIQTAG